MRNTRRINSKTLLEIDHGFISIKELTRQRDTEIKRYLRKAAKLNKGSIDKHQNQEITSISDLL